MPGWSGTWPAPRSMAPGDRTSPGLRAACCDVIRPRLDQHDVAQLSERVISLMTRDELLEVILASQLPLLNDDRLSHLSYANRSTLERGAYLGRLCCRNQGH